MSEILKHAFRSKLSIWAITSLALTSAIYEQFGVRLLDPEAVASPLHSTLAVVLLFVLVAFGLLCFYRIVAYRKLYPFLGGLLLAAGGLDLFDLLYLGGEFLPALHAHWSVFFSVAGTFMLLDYENYRRLVRR